MLTEKINISLKNNNVIFLKGVFKNTPNWENFISLIDHVCSDKYISTKIREVPLGLNTDMYLRIADALDTESQKSSMGLIPHLDKVVSYLNSEIGSNSIYSECYINFTKNTSVLKPHNDPWIAAAWGCIGESEWRIYKSPHATAYESYILCPGDIIVVPMGVFHSVVPITPRATLTFAYPGNSPS